MAQSFYLCIDLKSFYASVECVERGLDPMTTRLVVADPERTEKTICLAVSPALKALGVAGRARVFELPRSVDYIMAPPRMSLYIDYSAYIYKIYLRFFSKDDIHVYSIDEVFIDMTPYLSYYACTPRELAEQVRAAVLDEVGIPATCGIGTNLYLAKIALDITAKHSPDFFGELNQTSFKSKLWDHRPLKDFWRIGKGIQKRLEKMGIHTMGELALYPDYEALYDEFGIDAEIIIDHAWGWEPVGIKEIKEYVPKIKSITNGQVLASSYSVQEAAIVLREMLETSCLELIKKGCVTRGVNLVIRYEKDELGRTPVSNGTESFAAFTDSRSKILKAGLKLFYKIAIPVMGIRGLMITFNDVMPEENKPQSFFDYLDENVDEKARQASILEIQEKFGKNAVLKGISLLPRATQRERNEQIGGHKS